MPRGHELLACVLFLLIPICVHILILVAGHDGTRVGLRSLATQSFSSCSGASPIKLKVWEDSATAALKTSLSPCCSLHFVSPFRRWSAAGCWQLGRPPAAPPALLSARLHGHKPRQPRCVWLGPINSRLSNNGLISMTFYVFLFFFQLKEKKNDRKLTF